KASLARIAQRGGISKGVLTYHFATKDEMLRLAATQFFDDAWAYMAPRITAADSAASKIHAWISAELEYVAAHRTQFLAMSDIVANHRDHHGHHAFAQEFDEELTGLHDILVQGQHQGEFRDFDAYRVANILSRTIEGLLTCWACDPTLGHAQDTSGLL